MIEELEMDKSLSVAAAKQELHAALESKDEELTKASERIKELDAENEALKHHISQGWHRHCFSSESLATRGCIKYVLIN